MKNKFPIELIKINPEEIIETDYTKRIISLDTIFLYSNNIYSKNYSYFNLEFDNKNGWICISPKYKIINNFVKCEYRKETEIDCHEQCLTCLLLRNGECQCIESKLQINFEYIC